MPPSHPSQTISKNWPIQQLPGLSAENQQQLIGCGIETTLQLLHATRTEAQRRAIAQRLRIHPQYLTRWIALADLARIPDVGCQYCGLLLHAGILSPAQLAHTPLPRLHRQLLKLQVALFQRRDLCPPVNQVAQWIQQARRLPPIRS